MSFAIIEYTGSQFLVKTDDVITILGQSIPVNTEVAARLLLLNDGQKIEIGQPYLKKTARLMVVSHDKGDKIVVSTYKAKSRYRRQRGFRDTRSTLKVVSLNDTKTTAQVKTRSPIAKIPVKKTTKKLAKS